MAEYIERRALFRKLCEFWNIPLDWDGGVNEICEDAFTVIEDFPAADVAPVVHGRWVAVDGDSPCDEWDCTACGQRRTYMCEMDADDMKEFYPYCPNCGARMDLKEGENDGTVD